ncbi:hypothetical protein HanPSC8_Chr01g0027721 [Helianthus annuus]|nr:hypothetical protein HanPSC8_Chr01g0027721 [Helianthus annuus]
MHSRKQTKPFHIDTTWFFPCFILKCSHHKDKSLNYCCSLINKQIIKEVIFIN